MTSRNLVLSVVVVLVAGCSSRPPAVTDDMRRVDGELPADFSGNWERDYARSDEVDDVLRRVWYELSRAQQDPAYPAPSTPRNLNSLLPLARLAEEITRPDVLTITQDETRILVEREDDFAITCEFHGGVAAPTDSDYGTELCGWDGEHLVSHLELPRGLEVTHRMTVSGDQESLRIVTTVASPTSRLPFTLRRFYRKFEYMPSGFRCIETLSKKRVCSTGELEP